MKLISFVKKSSCLLLLFTCFVNKGNFSAFAIDTKEKQNNISKDSFNISKDSGVELINDEYILDSGDNLFIGFIGLDIFKNDYLIDREGFINLPEIGKYYVRGKTVSELIIDLKIRYEEFIYDPELVINIAFFRPVNVYVSGEVANPGLYDLSTSLIKNKEETILSPSFPRLFDLLRTAGGVTNYSDLSKIEVIRTNPKHNGGGKKKANINLLDLITKGEQDNNIFIYDDDIVYVPKSTEIIADQMMKINKINLNPEFIQVFVSGDVPVIGAKSMKKGASLNQAIAQSGGKRIFSGKVEFIRFNSGGKVERRLVKYDSTSNTDSYSNPVLMDGDIINVRKTPIGIVSDALNEFAAPIGTTYSLIDIFGGFK